MAQPSALHFALELAARPVLANAMQRQPLPSAVLDLIRIAAECPETLERAHAKTGVQKEKIREAAVLYLQNILFAPSADSYRILGVTPDASREEIRRHMRWLMKYLHPDREKTDWESAFAERVLSAWDDLKSSERRAQYDRAKSKEPPVHRRSRREWRRPWMPHVQPASGMAARSGSRFYGIRSLGVFIGVAALALVLLLGWFRQGL